MPARRRKPATRKSKHVNPEVWSTQDLDFEEIEVIRALRSWPYGKSGLIAGITARILKAQDARLAAWEVPDGHIH